MAEPDIGVTLLIHIDLLPHESGGRAQPVQNGYRPLCVMPRSGGAEVIIGLCELGLAHDLPAGGSGEGRLSFSTDVSDEVKSLVTVGSRFFLAEGSRRIGTAEVRRVE